MLILFYFIRQSTADCLNRSGYALPKFNMCIITNSILNKIAEIQEKSQQRKLKQGKDNGERIEKAVALFHIQTYNIL